MQVINENENQIIRFVHFTSLVEIKVVLVQSQQVADEETKYLTQEVCFTLLRICFVRNPCLLYARVSVYQK